MVSFRLEEIPSRMLHQKSPPDKNPILYHGYNSSEDCNRSASDYKNCTTPSQHNPSLKAEGSMTHQRPRIACSQTRTETPSKELILRTQLDPSHDSAPTAAKDNPVDLTHSSPRVDMGLGPGRINQQSNVQPAAPHAPSHLQSGRTADHVARRGSYAQSKKNCASDSPRT